MDVLLVLGFGSDKQPELLESQTETVGYEKQKQGYVYNVYVYMYTHVYACLCLRNTYVCIYINLYLQEGQWNSL